MKRLATKAVCSVGMVLGLVFTMDLELTISEQDLAHIANLEGCDPRPTSELLMFGLLG